MRADGSDLKNITNNLATDMWSSWSREGRIAFMSDRDGNNDIYVMNADGSAVRRVTKGRQEPILHGRLWKRIASVPREGKWQLYVMNGDGLNKPGHENEV